MTEARVLVPEGFDFETYINSYTGNSRISRTIFIAKQCKLLAVEAYKTALQEIKKSTLNTTKYNQVLESLNIILGEQGHQLEKADQEWISNACKTNKITAEALENDLKAAKSNLVKEDIRTCFAKFGDYYYKKGDLPTAMKNYIRTRDYSTTSDHILEMCFHIIKIYLDDCNYSHVVQTYISRAEATPNIADKVNIMSKLKCCQVLALLGGGDYPNRYQLVANALQEVSYEALPHISDILSANDIAIYGGLCALVTFDRKKLQQQVLNNANFKNFLVLEPSLHELLHAFYQSKYSVCFDLLEKYRSLLKLDMYLASHIDQLIQLVREKAMVQYCIPYSMIDMRKMAAAFNISVDALEGDLVDLIGKKEKISARIDSYKKILCTKKQEKRNEALDCSVLAGDDYEKSTNALLLRLNLLKANLVVK